MIYIEESQLQQLLEAEYKKGVQHGAKIMQQRMLLACENGTPIEIEGWAFFVRSDLQNLRQIMDDIEKGVYEHE